MPVAPPAQRHRQHPERKERPRYVSCGSVAPAVRADCRGTKKVVELHPGGAKRSVDDILSFTHVDGPRGYGNQRSRLLCSPLRASGQVCDVKELALVSDLKRAHVKVVGVGHEPDRWAFHKPGAAAGHHVERNKVAAPALDTAECAGLQGLSSEPEPALVELAIALGFRECDASAHAPAAVIGPRAGVVSSGGHCTSANTAAALHSRLWHGDCACFIKTFVDQTRHTFRTYVWPMADVVARGGI
eukprot:5153584-Prymnesium_polylepis.1